MVSIWNIGFSVRLWSSVLCFDLQTESNTAVPALINIALENFDVFSLPCMTYLALFSHQSYPSRTKFPYSHAFSPSDDDVWSRNNRTTGPLFLSCSLDFFGTLLGWGYCTNIKAELRNMALWYLVRTIEWMNPQPFMHLHEFAYRYEKKDTFMWKKMKDSVLLLCHEHMISQFNPLSIK